MRRLIYIGLTLFLLVQDPVLLFGQLGSSYEQFKRITGIKPAASDLSVKQNIL